MLSVSGGADDFVRALIRRRDVADNLLRVPLATAEERKHGTRLVAGLRPHHGIVEGAAVNTRRRAGLQAPDLERLLAQACREAVRRRIPGAPAFVAL
jgi:hypothetical protein